MFLLPYIILRILFTQHYIVRTFIIFINVYLDYIFYIIILYI